MNDFDLNDFAAAVHEHGPSWQAAGIDWQLLFGPTRDKPAAWVTCETTRTLAQLTIWTSGEAELDTGDVANGTHTSTHYDITTPQDLTACLDDLTQKLNPPPTP